MSVYVPGRGCLGYRASIERIKEGRKEVVNLNFRLGNNKTHSARVKIKRDEQITVILSPKTP